MRTLLLGGLFGLALVTSASAADLRYGWDRPEPPAPAPTYEADEGNEGPLWREPEWRRPPPPRVRLEEQDDEGDEPRCWVRRTPYGPERVCR